MWFAKLPCVLTCCPQAISYDDIKIDRQLGEGGFAEVFKGVYQGVDVAVKRWKIQSLPADQMELFRREVECNKFVFYC